jgi:hypothetical protein
VYARHVLHQMLHHVRDAAGLETLLLPPPARTSGNGGPASLIAQLSLGHGAFERRPHLTQDQLAELVGSRTLAGALFARLGK